MRYVRLGIWLTVGVVVACVCAVWYVALATKDHRYTASDAPSAEVAMVLGASVTSKGVLSPVLQQRADTAVSLYISGKVDKILVTGDDGSLTYHEVYPVGKYLLAAGIPPADIFLDYAGFDTYSSMYRAREVFGVTSVLIVSQGFHLPRAVFVARQLGLDARGVDASHGEAFVKNSIREVPATAKALFDLATHRVPKYLGEPFPVSGEGTATWVGDVPQAPYFIK